MTTYQDLCQALKDKTDRIFEKYTTLFTTIGELNLALTNDLDLKDKTWEGLDKKRFPYVFCMQDDNSETIIDNSNLPQLKFQEHEDYSSISYNLITTLEDGPNTYPKTHIPVPMEARINGDNEVRFLVGKLENQREFIIYGHESFKQVIVYYKELMLEELNK